MRRPLLGLVLVIAVAAAGCGESAKKQRQEFLAKANGICGHFGRLQNDVRFPSANPLAAATSHAVRAQWGLALNQIVNYGRQEVRGLRKLKPPKDLRDGFDEMLDAKGAAFDDLAKGADAAKRNHRTEIKPPVEAGRKKLARVSTLAKKIGTPQCT